MEYTQNSPNRDDIEYASSYGEPTQLVERFYLDQDDNANDIIVPESDNDSVIVTDSDDSIIMSSDSSNDMDDDETVASDDTVGYTDPYAFEDVDERDASIVNDYEESPYSNFLSKATQRSPALSIEAEEEEEEDWDVNRCLVCGVNMGASNPRQYCGKAYCTNE